MPRRCGKDPGMARLFAMMGAVFSGLAVAFGAFGAHSLKAILPEASLSVFETAVRYQMYHGLGLVLVGMAARAGIHRCIAPAGWAFLTGIVLFSGSLYLLALLNIRWLGAITPLGGLLFIVGWVLLAVGVWKARDWKP